MAATTIATDSHPNRTRWGGGILALGMVLTVTAFSIYFFGVPPPDPNGTPATRAADYVEGRDAIIASGWIGVYADILVAVAALFLATRAFQGRTRTPVSAFWLVAAIGALMFAGIDAFYANGMIRIAENYATNTILFEAAEATTNAFFGLGILAVSLGTFVVLWGETVANAPVVPKWVAYAGMVGAAASIVGGLGVILGVEALGFGLFGAYLLFLSLIWFGLRLAMPGTAPTTETEARPARGARA